MFNRLISVVVFRRSGGKIQESVGNPVSAFVGWSVLCYNEQAALDGEVAVPCNPQSAIAGLNSRLRLSSCGVRPMQEVLTNRSCATGTSEPCQVLTEAALRRHFRVPQGCLIRAECMGPAQAEEVEGGCAVHNSRSLSEPKSTVRFFLKEVREAGRINGIRKNIDI